MHSKTLNHSAIDYKLSFLASYKDALSKRSFFLALISCRICLWILSSSYVIDSIGILFRLLNNALAPPTLEGDI